MNLTKTILALIVLIILPSRLFITNAQDIVSRVVLVTPAVNKSLSKEEANDLASIRYSLSIAGIQFQSVNSNHINSTLLADYEIAIIPFASAKNMDSKLIALWSQAVSNGLKVFTDGYSPLGLQMVKPEDDKIEVVMVKDKFFTTDTLIWIDTCKIQPIQNKSNQIVLSSDLDNDKPLAVCASFGKGKLLFFAPLFDPITNKGYSRFPFLIETLEKFFALKRPAERSCMEVYFDPGMRDRTNIDSLVNQWKLKKVKKVFAGGWYYDSGYDYKQLIESCHQNGIAVYCWLETPMVSMKFWKDHPEWREKTATLRDALVDWRYMMNMIDTACRNEAFRQIGAFISSNDWDGLNIAEIYFEPSGGMNFIESFTPMNQLVRNNYIKKEGIDPLQFFNDKDVHYWKNDSVNWHKFLEYRKELCYQLKRDHVAFFDSLRGNNKDFEIILTFLDVSIATQVADYIGESTDNVLAIQKEYNLTLQVEDPSNCWGSTPERYKTLGNRFRKYVKDEEKLSMDCNVVISHEEGMGGFPSVIPCGEEIRQVTYNMGLNNARPAFYSEDVITSNDFKNIRTVGAHNTMIKKLSDNQWSIQTPHSVWINTYRQQFSASLDKSEWFATDSSMVLIPKGKHVLSLSQAKQQQTPFELNNFSGELLSASFEPKSINLNYTEKAGYCFATFSAKPNVITIDGVAATPVIYSKLATSFTVKLPKGKHKVAFQFIP